MTSFPQDFADLGSGRRMPLLGFGTWQIRGSHAGDAVGWALEAGYRHVDTATVYGNEKEVGAALTESGVGRDQLFVTTSARRATSAASWTRCATASTCLTRSTSICGSSTGRRAAATRSRCGKPSSRPRSKGSPAPSA